MTTPQIVPTKSTKVDVDNTIVAVFTVSTDKGLTEIVYVTLDRSGGPSDGRYGVYVEYPDGTGTRQIGSYPHENGDEAMSRALSHCGWGDLALTQALNEEGR